MATNKIQIDEGSTTNLATNSFTEDAVTKHVSRTSLNNSSGTEIGTSGNPLEVNLRSSTVGVATSAKQDTGNTSLASIDGKITAVDTGAVVISSGSVTADTELTTADLDTGAGTDTRAVVGLVGSKSGGGVLIPGDATKGLAVDLTATGANSTAIKVDGSAVTQPVSYATTGSGTATGALRVELPTNGTGTVGLNAGTNAIGKLAANSGVDIGDVDVTSAVITGGGVADDGTTPGNPIMMGGKAVETDGTDPTSVSAEDDVAIFRTDRNRRLLVNKSHPNLWSANDNQSSAQTNTQLKAAPGANLSLYITDIMISNGATAGDVRFVEDTAGTPAIKIPKVYVAANGGAVMAFETPIRITANKNFGYTSTTVTTHSVMANGFIAP